MLVKVNGVESEISDSISIQGLVSARKLPGDAIITVLNGSVITRELWESTRLSPADSLEIVRIMGGG